MGRLWASFLWLNRRTGAWPLGSRISLRQRHLTRLPEIPRDGSPRRALPTARNPPGPQAKAGPKPFRRRSMRPH